VTHRPVVGVTGPSRGGAAAWIMTSSAIRRAGGRPVRIHTERPELGRRIDALVVGGGADLDPELYREAAEGLGEALRAASEAEPETSRHPSSRIWAPALLLLRRVLAGGEMQRADAARDELERRLLAEAIDRDLPILGICRGAQLLNVYLGGTLYADVREFYVETPHIWTVLPRRWVLAEEESALARIVGATHFLVNALHHQAVKSLGRGLRVVARDDNGIVQAIEQPGHRFRIGVQWHPEYIPQHPRQRALFASLVASAGGSSWGCGA
jgi:putative glutamine amidotransferase